MVPSYSIYDESGELIHELVLCKNPEGRVGWWDTVDGLFRDYTENGAKIPEVDSGSVQYIDTGVFLNLQRCDGAGVDPAEHAAVCRERDALRARLAKATAERGYLVRVVGASEEGCDYCSHAADVGGCTFYGLCYECPSESCRCKGCHAGSCFEFAGVQEGGGG